MDVRAEFREKMPQIEEICRKYHVRELSLFGSALRDDFRPDSDYDLLVEFEPDARIGLIKYVELQETLADLLCRRVDLVSKEGLKPRIRDKVLSSAEPVYAA
jgi:uncharacterized protein